VDSIRFRPVDVAGISPDFDESAWRLFGGDLPVKPVAVHVSPSVVRSIDGVTEYEADKFKNHFGSISGPSEMWETAPYCREQGFFPGRSILKLREALVFAWGIKGVPTLREDPLRPGWSDDSFFKQYSQPDVAECERIAAIWPEDLAYAVCLDNWPDWMIGEKLRRINGRGTPSVKYFDSAADLAARFLLAEKKRMCGREPAWLEVKNETDVDSEWVYHADRSVDSWKLLADFHNTVADRVHEDFPDLKVGGPSSAWMMLDRSNFKIARNHLRFMDLTAGHLDVYSHHFYDSKDLVVHDPNRKAAPKGFLSGRLEAVLDLLRNHMILTDNLKPLLITETGPLHEGGEDIDYWIRLKTFSSYQIRYLNRANEFDLVVPFILPSWWWRKDCPNSIYIYDENGNLKLSPETYFLELWKDYRGRLAACDSDDSQVRVHSAVDENTVQVVLNNMNPQRVSVSLKGVDQAGGIVSATQRRLYFENGKLHFSDQPVESLDHIPLAVEETSIVTITLNKPVQPERMLTEKTWFGDGVLKQTGKRASFSVVIDEESRPECAKLRVCLGRENGFKGDLEIGVNGTSFKVPMDDTALPGAYFGYKEVDLPLDLIGQTNTISVFTPVAGGMISSVALDATYESELAK
jgi:agarase